MDLIETFLDLCDTGSFNQTAERLGVTQSTVSGRINALEKSLGVRVLERSRSGTALTTEGLRFEPHARALRHDWVTALNAAQETADSGVTMRIGLQHDLITLDIRDVISRFREVLSETKFLFEADYSAQMCADLIAARQDVAVLYSPTPHPDLHFEPIGEVDYVMVSTHAETMSDVDPTRYIMANYSAAFAGTHGALLPELSNASLSIGQNAAMVDLLLSLGGSAYVLRHSAQVLNSKETCKRVKGAPVISQPIFSGVHIRRRHRGANRKLISILKNHYAAIG